MLRVWHQICCSRQSQSDRLPQSVVQWNKIKVNQIGFANRKNFQFLEKLHPYCNQKPHSQIWLRTEQNNQPIWIWVGDANKAGTEGWLPRSAIQEQNYCNWWRFWKGYGSQVEVFNKICLLVATQHDILHDAKSLEICPDEWWDGHPKKHRVASPYREETISLQISGIQSKK